MFKKIIDIHQSDSRIPSFLGRYIDCDLSIVNGLRFFVADGVTRDLKNGEEFKIPRTPKEIIDTYKYFPDIDKLQYIVYKVAKGFVLSNEKDIKKLLGIINTEIMDYYKTVIKGPNDYLGKNYLGMTASGGFIEEDSLKAFNIGDSNIILLDKFFDTIYKTRDSVKDLEALRNKDVLKRNPIIAESDYNYWSDRHFRSWYRSQYVNSDNPYSFGVLNGEEKALEKVNYYDWSLKHVNFILSYTDGFDEVLEKKENIRNLTLSKKIKTKKEGTIVGFKRI